MPGYESLYGDMLSSKKKKGKASPYYTGGTSDVSDMGLDIDQPSTMVKKKKIKNERRRIQH